MYLPVLQPTVLVGEVSTLPVDETATFTVRRLQAEKVASKLAEEEGIE